ncbi:refilin-B-like [Eleutherodactylus coqui]|uniref:refilin-B-like n=1 Tax=Eleutherodactylus coqui TaxID=57060 RepID=UPI003462FDB0
MVGRLNLQDVPDLLDMKKRGERVLDSPDSGLPPSPCPSNWLLSPAAGDKPCEQDISGHTVQVCSLESNFLGECTFLSNLSPSSWYKTLNVGGSVRHKVSGAVRVLAEFGATMKVIPDESEVHSCFSESRSTSPSLSLSSSYTPRLCPLSFGEGVELDPLPPKEIR